MVLRVLFYAVDGLGLGHVTRLLAIARAARGLAPTMEVLFLTSSDASQVIASEGFAAFKVPSRTIRAAVALSHGTYLQTVGMVTTSLVAAFAPHVLVVDTFPAGASDDLVPVLRWPLERVFVFREQRPEHARAAHFQHCLRAYHRTVVPHSSGEVALPLPEGVAATWTGPILIRERGEALPRPEARARLGVEPGERPLVLVSGAGGGDPALVAWAGRAAAALTEAGFEVVLAVGPLARQMHPPRLRTTSHYPLAELLPAFDAALAPCSYNTAHELLHHGVPTAFVTATRELDDQQERRRRLVQAGAALALEEESARAAVAVVRRLLDPACAAALRRAGRALVPGGGAQRAARAVLKLPG